MKLYSIIFYLLFSLSSMMFAVQEDVNFSRGNNFFMQQQYAKACGAYEKIENKGFIVLYNIGLAYLNQGNRSQAIVYGKRAEKQAGFHELTQLYSFFDYIKRISDPDFVVSWYELFMRFLTKCARSISLLFLQIVLLIFLIVFMIGWYRRWYCIHIKALLAIAFFYVLLVSAWWYKSHIMYQQIGIVTQQLTPVFAGPDELFYKKSELHETDEVMILNKRSGYYQVQRQQIIGWIHDSDVELIE